MSDLAQSEPVEHVLVDIAEAAAFFLRERKRWKWAYGGRGGVKSWSAADALLLRGAEEPCRILCAREYQSSIKDSVHKLLSDQIKRLGMTGFYEPQKTTILGANGTEFIFGGLHHNVESIKSMEGIDICWVEEAETVSEDSWKILEPTIRKPGSEIWVTYNPAQPEDPTHVRCMRMKAQIEAGLRDDAIVRKVGWEDNPWLPDVLRKQAEEMRRDDPEGYAHVWGGEPWTRSDAQIFNGKYSIEEFTPGEDWDGPYYGADWGFAVDPTALVKVWIYDERLWVEHEAFAVGCELDSIPTLFDGVPGSRQHTIRADNARPETINHVAGKGFDVVACEKWPGCVEDGIAYLRSFKRIVIHPRCRHLQEEARLYRYKVDRLSKDVLPIIVDKHNHGWDAIRYAVEPMIQNASGGYSGMAG